MISHSQTNKSCVNSSSGSVDLKRISEAYIIQPITYNTNFKKKDTMIRNHCYLFCGIVTIYFSLLIRALASPTLHFNCRNDQRDALLEFRHEFPPTDDSNLSSWNKSSDCCLWNGVTCNDKSGQVISLDLHDTSLNSSLKTCQVTPSQAISHNPWQI